MNTDIILICIISFAISLITIPVIIVLSHRYRLYDSISERKIHSGNISRLGGLAVFLAFFPVAVYFNGWGKNYPLIAAMITAFFSGFIDDIVSMRARYKLVIQIIAASLAVYSGLLIQNIRIYNFYNLEFGIFSYFITVLWIVTFMNAVNLIDGMDGLSSGIVLVANLFVIIIAAMTQNYKALTLSVILEFSVLGFYLFNFPPAKIFLGDGGAYFIGFIYAVIPLMGIKKSAALTVFLIPMILMLIPISDIVSVMYKRYKTGHNIFYPDNNHLHHRLMNLGFSTRGILALIYSFTLMLGCFSLLMVAGKPELTIFMLVFIIAFMGLLSFTLNKAESVIHNLKLDRESSKDLLRKSLDNVRFFRKIS